LASPPPRWLIAAAAAAVVLGVFLRFSNLPRKLFWLDEAWTSLRISGASQADVARDLYDGRVLSPEDLLRYQRVTPERGVVRVALAHVRDDPQQPPLYYVLARFWASLFGDGTGPLRALSAVFGTVAVAAAYALAREAFSGEAGLVAACLVALSPFQVLYSQEARSYELLCLLVLFSGTALLRAMRLSTRLAWILYAAALAAGLYTSVLFLLVALAHLAFVALSWRSWGSVARRGFLRAAAASVVSFAPWLGVLAAHRADAIASAGWVATRIPSGRLFTGALDSLVAPFADSLDGPARSFRAATPCVLVFSAWALAAISRRAKRKGALLVVCLTLVPFFGLFLPDLLFGGVRTTYPRYLFAALTGLSLAAAGAIAPLLESGGGRRMAGGALLATLLALGAAGSWRSNQSPCWWNSFRCAETIEAARLVNAEIRPVLVAHEDWWIPNALAFSHLLDPKVRIQLVRGGATPAVPADASAVFLATHTDPRLSADGAFAGWRVEPAVSFWFFRRVD
jgi:uncharacterized membrane protein